MSEATETHDQDDQVSQDGPSGLEHLEAEAISMGAKPAAAVQAVQDEQKRQAQAQVLELGQELAGAIEVFRDMAVEATELREIPLIWTDQRISAIGMAGAAVMIKRGWNMEHVGRWMPEIALLAAVALPTVQTVKLVKARQAEALQRAQAQTHGQPEGATA